jgi:hypothetical protein
MIVSDEIGPDEAVLIGIGPGIRVLRTADGVVVRRGPERELQRIDDEERGVPMKKAGDWHAKAMRLKTEGRTPDQIAAACGKSIGAVRWLFEIGGRAARKRASSAVVVVPAWVPDNLRQTYLDTADATSEQEAASYVRRLKHGTAQTVG